MKQKLYYSGEVATYLELLQEDIRENHRIAKLFDGLFFERGTGISHWLDSLHPERSFETAQSSVSFAGKINASLNAGNIMELCKANVDFLDIRPFDYFTTRTVGSEVEMQRMFLQQYYLVVPGFYSILDRHFFECLPDYSFNGKRHTATKFINKDVSIVIKQGLKFIESIEIDQYRFPGVAIEYRGNKLYFLRDFDLWRLLFLPAHSFITFFNEKSEFLYTPDGQVSGVERKQDQPIVGFNADTGQYEIFNDKDKVCVYNAFIQMVLKLHVHYFRIFEKWLITTVIPGLQKADLPLPQT